MQSTTADVLGGEMEMSPRRDLAVHGSDLRHIFRTQLLRPHDSHLKRPTITRALNHALHTDLAGMTQCTPLSEDVRNPRA